MAGLTKRQIEIMIVAFSYLTSKDRCSGVGASKNIEFDATKDWQTKIYKLFHIFTSVADVLRILWSNQGSIENVTEIEQLRNFGQFRFQIPRKFCTHLACNTLVRHIFFFYVFLCRSLPYEIFAPTVLGLMTTSSSFWHRTACNLRCPLSYPIHLGILHPTSTFRLPHFALLTTIKNGS